MKPGPHASSHAELAMTVSPLNAVPAAMSHATSPETPMSFWFGTKPSHAVFDEWEHAGIARIAAAT